jgi:hypothetical protein
MEGLQVPNSRNPLHFHGLRKMKPALSKILAFLLVSIFVTGAKSPPSLQAQRGRDVGIECMLRLRGGMPRRPREELSEDSESRTGAPPQEQFNVGGWPEKEWQFGEDAEEAEAKEEEEEEQALQELKISEHIKELGVLKKRRRRIDDPNAPEMARQFGVEDEFSQEGDKGLIYDWMYYGTSYQGKRGGKKKLNQARVRAHRHVCTRT